MFGSIAWMLNGHMACGVRSDDLFVRLEPDDAERALSEPHVREAEFSGRTMRGVITLDGEAVAEPSELARWVDACADYAASRPPK
jgi:TfoX N-terminal domain